MVTPQAPTPKCFRLGELLPQAFGPGDLGVTEQFLAHRRNDVRLADPERAGATNPAVIAAVAAAAESYAPHSGCPAGVALSIGGKIFTGSYVSCLPATRCLPR